MKKLLLLLAILFFAAPAFADQYVKGHHDRDGNWHPGYWRTDPNGTPDDNYSNPGVYNPHKPQLNFTPKPPTPYTPYTDRGTPLGPGPTVTVPKLNATPGSLGKKECVEPKSIYEPRCP